MLCYASYISLPRYFYLMHNGESEGDEAEWWNRDILQSETLCNFLYVNVSSSIEEAGIYIFSSKTFCNFPNVNVSSLKGGVGQILGTLVTSMTWVLALSYLLWRFEILFYMNTWTSFFTFLFTARGYREPSNWGSLLQRLHWQPHFLCEAFDGCLEISNIQLK